MSSSDPGSELDDLDGGSQRCGFKTEGGSAHGISLCNRESSEPDGRCFWHSSRKKSITEVIDQLNRERSFQDHEGPTIIRGMILEQVSIGDDIDFDGLDCAGCKLTDVDLTRTEISGTVFDGGTISDSDFSKTHFENVSFSEASLERVKMIDISGKNVFYKDSHITSTQFRWSDGDEIYYSNSKIQDSSFNQSRIRNGFFETADLTNSEFLGTTIIKSDFSNSSFDGVDMEGRFRDGSFKNAEIYESDLSDVDFEDVNLRGLFVSRSDLNNSDLSGLDLEDCELRESNFHNSTMFGINLVESEVVDCGFIGSTLDDSVFDDMNSVDTEFTGSSIENSTLKNSEFAYGSFEGVGLRDTDIIECEFVDVKMMGMKAGPDLYIDQSDFEGIELMCTDFSESIISKSYFKGSELLSAGFEGTIIEKVDLRKSDCRLAQFWDADLRDVRIDNETKLGSKCIYELEKFAEIYQDDVLNLSEFTSSEETFADLLNLDELTNSEGSADGLRSRLSKTILPRNGWHCWNSDTEDELYDFQKSIRVYRAYRGLCDDNQLSDRSRTFHTREREAERKYHFLNGNLGKWTYLASQKHIMGYGNGYLNVLITSALTIVFSAIAYLFVGGVESTQSTGTMYSITPGWLPRFGIPSWVPDIIVSFGASMYFSVVTFSTLGYGDLQPGSPFAKFLAGAESLAGVVLTAVFVFVLTRRATW
ncbi:pentapeptide repeat-containing protein [Halosimplex pelagicum]|uniref:Pentapeptide repeat-containing protein n=1 Tax=Halosimplex pelagicum TaxID=869886 RepID=A0A7D5PC65_9EURY|nr:pentapeptide repeat-containing protein [Halosimplex pelagicum]QLH84801.1 pentapeptide repeat-containing protein [Halosimplex pelagicum]